MHIVFETPRLFLRQFTEADAALVFSLSNPEIIRYVHERLLQNEEEAQKILTNVIIPQYELNLGRWATFTKAGNEFIGWCGIKKPEDRATIDLGYRFLKTAWGKGYATEAARHTLEYGLKELSIEVITGTAHINNMASIKVMEKCGMKLLRDDIEDDVPVKIYTVSLSDLPPAC